MKFKLVILFSLFFASTYAQSFKVGVAVSSLTPEKLIPISGGLGTPVYPESFKGELTARAIVFDDGTEKVCFVSVDNLGWPAALADKSRALVKGIKPENILVSSTHTHSAPDAYAIKQQDGSTNADLAYLDWCVKQIAKAINEADKKRQSAQIKINVADAKGQIAFNYYAPDLYDPRCAVIQAFATEGENKGKAIATLVNYASHPEVLGTKAKMMSPDFCGPFYDRIEEKGGGIAIFINGAQGGMVTADVRINGDNTNHRTTWGECVRIGELLADESLRIIGEASFENAPRIHAISQEVAFPVESQTMKFILENSHHQYKTIQKENQTSAVTRMNMINIGKATILTIPGEALPNIGYYLKRKMKTQYPFLFGLTNDALGYILTKEDFGSFKRYEYISRTSLGENTGEVLIEEAMKLIEQMPPSK